MKLEEIIEKLAEKIRKRIETDVIDGWSIETTDEYSIHAAEAAVEFLKSNNELFEAMRAEKEELLGYWVPAQKKLLFAPYHDEYHPLPGKDHCNCVPVWVDIPETKESLDE